LVSLQKLRWYCQMCQKQCRDANGFKCHCESEGHLRSLKLFGESSGKIVDEFSREFENGMMDIIKRRYRNKRIHANIVYNEYIQDREHTHMNATKWVTLSGFVTYLAKAGKCKVEETPKGWYIMYIEKDADELAKQERHEKKEKMELDEEQRNQKAIEARLKRAKEANKKPEFTELKRDENSETKIEFSLNSNPNLESIEEGEDLKKPTKPIKFNWNTEEEELQELKVELPQKRKASALDIIILEEEKKKDMQNRKDFWLTEDIVVKVMNSDLAEGKYYKEKGVVKKVFDKYVALVRMVDSGDVLKLDQSQLETVIPAIGTKVKVVNGAYRGETATLVAIDADQFSAHIKLDTGSRMGNIVSAEYEDICKLNTK